MTLHLVSLALLVGIAIGRAGSLREVRQAQSDLMAGLYARHSLQIHLAAEDAARRVP